MASHWPGGALRPGVAASGRGLAEIPVEDVIRWGSPAAATAESWDVEGWRSQPAARPARSRRGGARAAAAPPHLVGHRNRVAGRSRRPVGAPTRPM